MWWLSLDWQAGELAAAAEAAAAAGIDTRRSGPIPMWHPSIQSCPVPSHPIPWLACHCHARLRGYAHVPVDVYPLAYIVVGKGLYVRWV